MKEILENKDRLRRGEAVRPTQPKREPDRPPPAPKAYTDEHFLQGQHIKFQSLYLTGSLYDRTLPDIYTTKQLDREVARGIHPVAIGYMQRISYLCRLFHVIQCEGTRDWAFEIDGDAPSWDDHAVSLEKMYLKMITDSGFHEYACPGQRDFRAIARMASADEPEDTIDPYLWDMIFESYWSFPTPMFVNRPTLVIADSCLNHSGRSGAKDMRKLFLNDNADNSILHKHCETKITRAIWEKDTQLYAKFTYVLGIATDQDLEALFDVRDQDIPQGPTDEGQKRGGLTGKTTPNAGQQMYTSKYVKKYPPECTLYQQTVEVQGNGQPTQYMGQIPHPEMLHWVKRFAEGQRRIKGDNARFAHDNGYTQSKRILPEIPTALLDTMAEVNLAFAINAFNYMDDKYRRVTGLNFEDPGSRIQGYEYDQYIDVVVRPILGDKMGINAVDANTLFNISKSLTGKGQHSGAADGWIDLRMVTTGHSARNVLLAMMQGEKPRYESRIINNPSGTDQMEDLDVKILKYRVLQGHFSRMQEGREAVGSDPGSVSTLIKLVADTPGDARPKMRYGYHASALSLRAFDNIVQKGLVPGGHSDGDYAIRDSVHLCPLRPTHNDAVGIWGLNKPPKEKNKYDGYTIQAIFLVDLLMLQEEYEVGIYQARSGNYLIPSVVPWNCICLVINSRGSPIDIWNGKVTYGALDLCLDAERLTSERQKKRTKTADNEFEERRSKMDRVEFANIFSSSASASAPKMKPPPPPPKGTASPPSGKSPPPGPPPPSGSAASSSSSGAQFGTGSVPKKAPPMHVKGAIKTRMRPLGETIGTTWSGGMYGENLSESSDVKAYFEKLLPQTSSRLNIFTDQDMYHIPDEHPSSLLWPKKVYHSLDGPLIVTLDDGEVYSFPRVGGADRRNGCIGPSMETFDLARSIDYLLGYMIDYERELQERVKQEIEHKLDRFTNDELLFEGAAWF
eukprot:2161479-Amphidinium_carterae.3